MDNSIRSIHLILTLYNLKWNLENVLLNWCKKHYTHEYDYFANFFHLQILLQFFFGFCLTAIDSRWELENHYLSVFLFDFFLFLPFIENENQKIRFLNTNINSMACIAEYCLSLNFISQQFLMPKLRTLCYLFQWWIGCFNTTIDRNSINFFYHIIPVRCRFRFQYKKTLFST